MFWHDLIQVVTYKIIMYTLKQLYKEEWAKIPP